MYILPWPGAILRWCAQGGGGESQEHNVHAGDQAAKKETPFWIRPVEMGCRTIPPLFMTHSAASRLGADSASMPRLMAVPRLSVVMLVPLAACVSGCAGREPIPRYPWRGAGEALRGMAERAAALHTGSTQSDLTLYKTGG